jgi:hypothetical protein
VRHQITAILETDRDFGDLTQNAVSDEDIHDACLAVAATIDLSEEVGLAAFKAALAALGEAGAATGDGPANLKRTCDNHLIHQPSPPAGGLSHFWSLNSAFQPHPQTRGEPIMGWTFMPSRGRDRMEIIRDLLDCETDVYAQKVIDHAVVGTTVYLLVARTPKAAWEPNTSYVNDANGRFRWIAVVLTRQASVSIWNAPADVTGMALAPGDDTMPANWAARNRPISRRMNHGIVRSSFMRDASTVFIRQSARTTMGALPPGVNVVQLAILSHLSVRRENQPERTAEGTDQQDE